LVVYHPYRPLLQYDFASLSSEQKWHFHWNNTLYLPILWALKLTPLRYSTMTLRCAILQVIAGCWHNRSDTVCLVSTFLEDWMQWNLYAFIISVTWCTVFFFCEWKLFVFHIQEILLYSL
jgi:hypothetical protein